MSDPDIIVSEVIDEEAAAVISGGLDSFNDRSVGYSDRQSLAALIKDPETGEVLGGATGRSSLGLLFLDLLYLPDSLRGSAHEF